MKILFRMTLRSFPLNVASARRVKQLPSQQASGPRRLKVSLTSTVAKERPRGFTYLAPFLPLDSNVSSNRTPNAVAGPSRRRSPSPRSNGRSSGPQAASGSKIKTSRYSMSQSAGKPAESVSAARTKTVRRTREEKQRRRSSVSSDEMPPPVPTLAPRKQGAPLPSASAPQARNGTFDRDKMRQRYQSGGSSNASSSREPKSAPVKKRGKGKSSCATIFLLLANRNNQSNELTRIPSKSLARRSQRSPGP
jgi:hypothetical protein